MAKAAPHRFSANLELATAGATYTYFAQDNASFVVSGGGFFSYSLPGEMSTEYTTALAVSDPKEYLGNIRYPLLTDTLVKLAHLPKNWDGYGTSPPTHRTIEQAQYVLRECFKENLVPLDVLASGEGGAGIAFGARERYADIEFLNSGSILAVTHGQASPTEVWPLSFTDTDISRAIERIRRHLYS